MIGKQKKVILAGAIGNALEWYDFTIYAFFVPMIAMQFFPNKDPFLSLLATFGVFAVGFLVRPLGAILFGYIGDHAGRKKALVLSMIMMSFPTFLIGILPDYHSIGVMAPILLIALRIIQGLAVSGELTTATVFLIEHAELNKRGVAGSLAMAGALFGMVLSAIFATSLSELVSDTQLAAWGWRIPFLLGGLIGVFGLMVRLRVVDPAVYEQAQASLTAQAQPISVVNHLASLNYRTLLIGIFRVLQYLFSGNTRVGIEAGDGGEYHCHCHTSDHDRAHGACIRLFWKAGSVGFRHVKSGCVDLSYLLVADATGYLFGIRRGGLVCIGSRRPDRCYSHNAC